MWVCTYDSHVILLSCYYRKPVDRDYKKITEQDCTQVMTHYEGNEFGRLTDVTTGPNDEVIVTDWDNGRVVVLDNKLNLLRVIGQGNGNSRLGSPEGISVTDNVIAVSDEGNHQVKKYSLQGEFLSVIGSYGYKIGQFNHPRGLTFNNNKLLYVVDCNNCRVQVFQQDNTFAFLFGERGRNAGQFQFPVKIVIDPNNNVLITDYWANCINIFTENGQFMQTIKRYEPWAITFSPTGYLITGHCGEYNLIRVFSPTYQLVNQFGKWGSEQGEFDFIRRIAIDSRGTIYVAEANNRRLQVISNS